MKLEFYMQKAYNEKLQANTRAQLLKEIKEEGIVDKIIAREKELEMELKQREEASQRHQQRR